MNQAILFLKTNNMKKIKCILLLFLFAPFFVIGQTTSNLLVKAVEKLPEEGIVIAQSTNIQNLELINSSQLDYSPILYKMEFSLHQTENQTTRKSGISFLRKKEQICFMLKK